MSVYRPQQTVVGNMTVETLPPRVEIVVERLDGIIWSTPDRPSNQKELEKRVPFVTAAVEFSGTCPNMRVYSANKYPHSKQPAVESFFASLATLESGEDKAGQVRGNEVKKITSTTTQEVGGKTTTTTTTTITTIEPLATPHQQHIDGRYPLVAKWYDDSREERLVDSVTYFTNAKTVTDAESRTGTLMTQGRKKNRPHLTLTLPAASNQPKPSILASMFAPCHHQRGGPSQASGNKEKGKHPNDHLDQTGTHSTAASTLCSGGSQNYVTDFGEKAYNSDSSQFTDLGSLLDNDGENEYDDEENGEASGHRRKAEHHNIVTHKDEADIAPVIATKQSKAAAATVIALEPSSAVVGRLDKSKSVGDAFVPISWMNCASSTPEIVELRVRVMPEDYDEFDELDPTKQHLAAAQDLEGVAHLVFLDQIVEEGTTVMDLPLKIAHEAKSMQRSMSTIPRIGDQEYVTLGSNAMLRVRVTILPETKTLVPAPEPNNLEQNILRSATMKTQEALPENSFSSFFSRPFSASVTVFEKILQMIQSYKDSNSVTRLAEEKVEKKQCRVPTGPFPHQFPTVVPDCRGKQVEPFFENQKAPQDSWGWFNNIPSVVKGKDAAGNSLSQSNKSGSHRRNAPREERDTKKFFTIPNVAHSSSSLMTESTDDASEADSEDAADMFIRSLQMA